MMNNFVYNEESRIHTLNGKIIPSVSNIVEPLYMDYSKVNSGKLKNKRDLGIAFHEDVRLFINDDLDEDSIGEDLKLPIQQFKEFWDKDFTEDTIYDWKLRKYDPVCDPLLMAGYEGLTHNITTNVRLVESPLCNEKLIYCGKPDLVVGNPPRKLIVVEFSLEGGYRVHDASCKQAWPMFRELLKWYWQKQKFENLCDK